MSLTTVAVTRTSVVALINNQRDGTPLTPRTFRAHLAHERDRTRTSGAAWQLTHLGTLWDQGEAWTAWRRGEHERAHNLLRGQVETLRARRQVWASQGVELRQLLMAPSGAPTDARCRFSVLSARVAVEAGFAVRVLLDPDPLTPEMTVCGDKVYRLRTSPHGVVAGAVDLESPPLAAAIYPQLAALWRQSTDLDTYTALLHGEAS